MARWVLSVTLSLRLPVFTASCKSEPKFASFVFTAYSSLSALGRNPHTPIYTLNPIRPRRKKRCSCPVLHIRTQIPIFFLQRGLRIRTFRGGRVLRHTIGIGTALDKSSFCLEEINPDLCPPRLQAYSTDAAFGEVGSGICSGSRV